MSKIFRFIALVFLGWFVLQQQSAVAQSTGTRDLGALNFRGGTAIMDLRLGSNLYGSGLSGGSFSGIYSALSPTDGATIFGNPAALSFVRYAQIGVESRFSVRNGSFGLGSTSNLPGSIERNTDKLLSNLSLPQDVLPVYTNAAYAAIGQPRQISAFWMTWPVTRHVGLGFGYRQPLVLSSNIALSGVQTWLSGQKAENSSTVKIDVLSDLAFNSNIALQVDEISVGTGGLLEAYSIGTVWWGATLYRYGASARIGLDVLPQGAVTLDGTDRYYFNDATDPNLNLAAGESNSFFWKINGSFAGSGYGARFGAVHRYFNDQFGASLVLNVAPRIEMWDGDATAQSFIPVFMDLEGIIKNDVEGVRDLLDVNAIDLSKPNQTRLTTMPSANGCLFICQLP